MDARTRLLRRAKSVCRDLSAIARRADHPDADDIARRAVVGAVARSVLAPDVADSLLAETSVVRGIETRLDDPLLRFAIEAIAGDHGEQGQSSESDLIADVHEALASPCGVGVHYTPSVVARYMAESAIADYMAATCSIDRDLASRIVKSCEGAIVDNAVAARILKRLRNATICDPACGTGHLLLATANCLSRVEACLNRSADVTDADVKARKRRIASQLHGYDIDADAIAIARLRITTWIDAKASSCDLDNPVGHVKARDSLNENEKAAAPCGFDIVIMNPPYVPTYSRQSRRDLREPIRDFACSRGLTGRLNLFGCFVVRSLEIAKPNGVLSLIVPDTFASATAYADLRRVCSARFGRQTWARIDARVFKAQVGSVILTCTGGPRMLSGISIDFGNAESVLTTNLGAKPLATDRGAGDQVLFFENDDERSIWKRVHAAGITTLDTFATIRDGVNTGPRRMRDLLLDPAAPSINRRPLIEGSDIDPRGFLLGKPARTILYDPAIVDDAARAAGASLRDPAIFESQKVVSRQTADTIVAALEPVGGIVALNSVHCICLPPGDRHLLPGVMAFLNSPLVRLFYALDGGEQRAVLPQVRIAWLRTLPLPPSARAMFETLAPIGLEVIDRIRSDADVHGQFDVIHGIVCDAFGFPTQRHECIHACYRTRFPRFASPSQSTRRRRASRVA